MKIQQQKLLTALVPDPSLIAQGIIVKNPKFNNIIFKNPFFQEPDDDIQGLLNYYLKGRNLVSKVETRDKKYISIYSTLENNPDTNLLPENLQVFFDHCVLASKIETNIFTCLIFYGVYYFFNVCYVTFYTQLLPFSCFLKELFACYVKLLFAMILALTLISITSQIPFSPQIRKITKNWIS